MMELCDFKASDLSKMLEKREVRSREITESVLTRIEERESNIKAYISVTADLAIKQAEDADQLLIKGKMKSPIHGIPTAIKDNICVEGVETTCASKILENYIPPYNAFAVQNLLNDGAVIIGKTNLDEFGMGSSTEKSIFGPTRNPFHQDYVAGGSSGGSAAAVAAGESILALGTDTGGSIRMPAAFCGVYGIKPTYGRVSRYGLISYASSLDQIGALARSVSDCALIMNSICRYDKKDSTSLNIPTPNYTSSLNKGVKGIKIGLPKEYYTEGLDLRIKEKILGAVDTLEKSGAEIFEISLPHTRYAVSTYYLIATAEASSNLSKYDGVKFGYRGSEKKSDLLTMYETSRSEGFGQEVKRRILLGTYVLSVGYYDSYYLKAKKARMLVKNDFDAALEKVDCILAPVTPSLPFKLGEKSADPLQMYLEDIYTVSLNLAGLPGMSVNCGTVEGLPVAFQIIGKPFDEATVIQVGSAYEGLKKSDPESNSGQSSS